MDVKLMLATAAVSTLAAELLFAPSPPATPPQTVQQPQVREAPADHAVVKALHRVADDNRWR